MARKRLWGFISLVILAVLIFGGLASYFAAVRMLKDKVTEALGPASEVRKIRLGWAGVGIEDLRIKGERDWPANDLVRAGAMTLTPSPLSFFSPVSQIRSIDIERPYLSIVRSREKKLLLLPGLLRKRPAERKGHPAWIGRMSMERGSLDFFDFSLKNPARVRFEDIRGSISNFEIPRASIKSRFDLTGTVKGIRGDGKAYLSGWVDFATKDSSVQVRLRSVDLTAIQQYLLKVNEAGIEKGTLDLDLQSQVRNKRLDASGQVTFTGLELASSGNPFSSFLGVPRTVLLNFLKTRGDRIILTFRMDGDISKPTFSLDETFRQQLAISLAEFFKMSIGGVARGVGTAGQKGAEAVGGVVKGIGNIIRGIFGGDKKK